MERSVFPRPEVSGLLAETVEARLHLDLTNHANFARMVEIRDKLVGVPTAPVYLILDPATDKVLGRQDGASSLATFRDWLAQSIDARS